MLRARRLVPVDVRDIPRRAQPRRAWMLRRIRRRLSGRRRSHAATMIIRTALRYTLPCAYALDATSIRHRVQAKAVLRGDLDQALVNNQRTMCVVCRIYKRGGESVRTERTDGDAHMLSAPARVGRPPSSRCAPSPCRGSCVCSALPFAPN